jgi:hypothetical protein
MVFVLLQCFPTYFFSKLFQNSALTFPTYFFFLFFSKIIFFFLILYVFFQNYFCWFFQIILFLATFSLLSQVSTLSTFPSWIEM